MTADPLSGAYAYFNAAISSGYQLLAVQYFDEVQKQPTRILKLFEIGEAKDRYNENRGTIYKRCVRGALWYFCKGDHFQLIKNDSK